MKKFIAIAAFALLAGCCTTPAGPDIGAPQISPPVAEAPASPDTCAMARFQNLIGSPASAIDRSALPAGTRVLEPNSIVTQDFREGRLNIMIGADGKVSGLRCF